MMTPAPTYFSMAHIANSFAEPGMSSLVRHAFSSGRSHCTMISESSVWSVSAVMPERPPALFFFRHLMRWCSSAAVMGSMTCGRMGGGVELFIDPCLAQA